jgi:rhodanese-related sulfurtransferase
MKRYKDLIADCLQSVEELLPWDLQKLIDSEAPPLLLDIREPHEFEKLHIPNSINVPRGILEQACEYGFDETEPKLVNAHDKNIIVICRSGKRSVLAAFTMLMMGYRAVKSLKMGIKGWNDFELLLQNLQGQLVDTDTADEILKPRLRADQLPPKKGVHTPTITKLKNNMELVF